MDKDTIDLIFILGGVFLIVSFFAQIQLFNIAHSLKQLVTTGHLILEELKKRGPQ